MLEGRLLEPGWVVKQPRLHMNFASGHSLPPLLLHPRVGSGVSRALFVSVRDASHFGRQSQASWRWVSQALMTFPAQQRALGRIVSYKTDLWIGFSFPSQPSTKEQQVLPPNKMTKSVTQMGWLSTVSGAVCRTHAIPSVLQEPGYSPEAPACFTPHPKIPHGQDALPEARLVHSLGRKTYLCSEGVSPGGQCPINLCERGSLADAKLSSARSGALGHPRGTRVGRARGAEGTGLCVGGSRVGAPEAWGCALQRAQDVQLAGLQGQGVQEGAQGRAPGCPLQLRAGCTSGRGGAHIWAALEGRGG